MADLQCPLAPHVIDSLPLHNRMNLSRVMEIEQHALTAGSCIHPPLAELVLHGSYDGSSPLLLACHEGHLDAVKHVVEEWGADVRASSAYYHRLGTETATPIFVAALRGHVQIVDFLIRNNADVSATTPAEGNLRYRGLTPLHAAMMEARPGQSFSDKCTESSLIVHHLLEAGAEPTTLALDGTPVWMRRFCCADSTIALVNHTLNLNQRNGKNETILHHWIKYPSIHHSTPGFNEEKRLVVVNSLIDSGADLMAQDNHGFTPILTSAESFTFNVLDLLLESDKIDRNDKIDAMELAGALLLFDDPEKANHYWENALLLRQEPNPISKVPLQMNSQSVVEWATLEELEGIMQDVDVHWIQSMLVRLRIYSYRSSAAVRDFLESAFSINDRFFGDLDGYEAYWNRVENPPTKTHIEDLLMAILGVIPRLEDPYGPMLWEFTPKLVAELNDYLIMVDDDPLSKVLRIKTSLQLILLADPESRIKFQYGFLEILAKFPDVLLQKDIRNYLSRTARKDDGILLATACEKQNWEILRLLLHLGANPNTRVDGNGPHHILAGLEEDPEVLNGKVTRVECAPAQLLFNYGGNPHAINHEGKTAVQIWMEKNCGGKGMQSIAWNHRPHWCHDSVPKLSSLAAKTINTYGINCSTSPLPLLNGLIAFLDEH